MEFNVQIQKKEEDSSYISLYPKASAENMIGMDSYIENKFVSNIVFGTYVGTGIDYDIINLDFTPGAILITNTKGQMNWSYAKGNATLHFYRGGFAMKDFPCETAIEIVENGIKVRSNMRESSLNGYYYYTNSKGETYYYLAFIF